MVSKKIIISLNFVYTISSIKKKKKKKNHLSAHTERIIRIMLPFTIVNVTTIFKN